MIIIIILGILLIIIILGKYFRMCQNFSARGCPGAQSRLM